MADTFFLRKADRSFGQHEQLFAGLRLEPPRPPAPERSPLSLSLFPVLTPARNIRNGPDRMMVVDLNYCRASNGPGGSA